MLPLENPERQPETLFDCILEECSLADHRNHSQRLHQDFFDLAHQEEREVAAPERQLECWLTLEEPEKEQFFSTTPETENKHLHPFQLHTISTLREEQEAKLATLLSSCRSLPLPQSEEVCWSEQGCNSTTHASPKKHKAIDKRHKKQRAAVLKRSQVLQ